MTFQAWSEKRMKEWIRQESFHSPMGVVRLNSVSGEWVAMVQVGEKLARVRETYISASVAMAEVERIWERERSKHGSNS